MFGEEVGDGDVEGLGDVPQMTRFDSINAVFVATYLFLADADLRGKFAAIEPGQTPRLLNIFPYQDIELVRCNHAARSSP